MFFLLKKEVAVFTMEREETINAPPVIQCVSYSEVLSRTVEKTATRRLDGSSLLKCMKEDCSYIAVISKITGDNISVRLSS